MKHHKHGKLHTVLPTAEDLKHITKDGDVRSETSEEEGQFQRKPATAALVFTISVKHNNVQHAESDTLQKL